MTKNNLDREPRPSAIKSALLNVKPGIKTVLAATTLGLGSLLAILYCQGESDSKNSTHEKTKPREITLGKVRLYVNESGKMTDAEIDELFINLESAYNKLKAYFGEEALIMTGALDCPIDIKPPGITEPSQVVWDIEFVPAPDPASKNGKSSTVRPNSVKLELQTTNEAAIAHELIHIYLQMPMTLSHTFSEGHAYAIERKLYGAKATRTDANTISEYKVFKESLTIGLDDDFLDNRRKGGVQNGDLRKVLKKLWEEQWIEYLKKDSDFFIKFYQKIAEKKKGGQSLIRKDELLETAKEVSPEFEAWFEKNAPTMQSIDGGNRESLLKAIVYPDGNTIVIINIQLSLQTINEEVEITRILPKLQGKKILTFKDKNTNERISRVYKSATFSVVDVTKLNMPPSMELERVTIGGVEVPISR